MERAFKIIFSIVIASFLLGWLLEPAMVIIGGGFMWLYILLIAGGAEDGNPYRTMSSTSMPDVFEVGRFMGSQKVAKKLPLNQILMRTLFVAGAILITIGILWMNYEGSW